jgi:translocation and assembly module TamB
MAPHSPDADPMAAPAIPPAPPATAPDAVPRRRRIGRLLLAAGLGATILGITMGAAAWLAVTTTRGAEFVAAWVPGLSLQATSGSLASGLAAGRLAWRDAAGTEVVVEGLRLGAPELELRPAPSARLQVLLPSLSADRVTVRTAPSGAPPTLPADLTVPIGLRIDAIEIGELLAPGLATPVRELRGSLALGADEGRRHDLDGLSARWGELRIQAEVRLGAEAPFPLQAEARLQMPPIPVLPGSARPGDAITDVLPPWQADLRAEGPLAGFDARGRLESEGQSVDLRARVTPTARFPLARLALQADALNLAALREGAPTTAVSGEITVEPGPDTAGGTPGDPPLLLSLQLRNERPGAWSDRLLPLAAATGQGRLRASLVEGLQVESLELQLADARGPAGRLVGRATWTSHGGSAEVQLEQVEPARLDARAPRAVLDGRLVLRAHDGSPASAAPASRAATAPSAPAAGPNIELELDLRGSSAALSARQLSLAGTASLTRERLVLRDVVARSEGGSARFAATVTRAMPAATPSGSASGAAGPIGWSALEWNTWNARSVAVQGAGSLERFDPSVWWPGAPGSAWRRGPHRLNGTFAVDARPAAGGGALARWPLGAATVTLADSVMAGLPLSAQAELRRGADGPASARVVAAAGPNRVDIDAELGAPGPSGDRALVRLNWPDLKALQPVADLLGDRSRTDATGGASPAGIAGALDLDVRASGRWPLLQVEARGRASALQWRNSSLANATLRAAASTAPGAALDLQVDASQWRQGPRTIETVAARFGGTLQQHQGTFEAVLRAVPPDWARALAGQGGEPDPKERVRINAAATGGWRVEGDAPGADRSVDHVVDAWQQSRGTRWSGRLERLEAAATPPGTTQWLRAGPTDLAVSTPTVAGSGGPARGWRVEVGAAEVATLGTVLRLDRLRWADATPSAEAMLDARASLEPFEVAPLLRRLQPDFGWEGDLTLGGRLAISTGTRTEIDLQVERRQGDLLVREETGLQRLGLEELRASIEARDGAWTFSAGFAGRQLGAASLLAVAQTSPRALWPEPTAPLRGIVDAGAANLGTWGAWLPAGWRLGGELRLRAALGGQFGGPQWTGELRGQGLSVRNLLQGVSISDGDLAVTLQGTTARIDRARARGGNGHISASGDATLGEQPRARLQLTAEQFQALGRVDRRVVVSGQAQADLDARGVRVTGRLGVDEALIDFTRADAPTLAGDVFVQRAEAQTTPVPERAPVIDPATGRRVLGPGPSRSVDLDLAVALGEKLRLRGRGLDAVLRGDLRLTSPQNRLAIQGTVRVADGTYVAYGQNLRITRGLLVFGGVPENPRLDFQATRPNLDVAVGVAVTGTAADPRVRLYSDPEMPEMEKLSWLLLGRASDGLGRDDMALLQRAALAVLAGEDSRSPNPLTSVLGIDDLSVRQSDGDTRDTIVSVGKQLHRRWYLGYERSLNATAGTWQLIYRLAQRFTVRAQSGEDNSLDLIWTLRWQ